MNNDRKRLVPHLSDKLNGQIRTVLNQDYIKALNRLRSMNNRDKDGVVRFQKAHDLYNSFIFYNPIFANMIKLHFELVYKTDISVCSKSYHCKIKL